MSVETSEEHAHLVDDEEEVEVSSRKCRVRPVHIFIGIACAMTLCGFVLTVYGGVKIYYHDVFKATAPIRSWAQLTCHWLRA